LSIKSISSLYIDGETIYAGVGSAGIWLRLLTDFNISTDIETIPKTDIVIYPTSVKDKLRISYPNTLSQLRIDIYNIYGKDVYFSAMSGCFTEIDMTNLVPGIYIVRIGRLGNNLLTTKIVKQ
jgi:hypothetical protein